MRSAFIIGLLAVCAASPCAAAPTLLEQAQQSEASGDMAAAEKIYRQVVAGSPKDANGWFGLARSLRQQGRARESRQAFERAIEVDTLKNPAILAGYATLEVREGRLDQALNLLSRAVDIGMRPEPLETLDQFKPLRARPEFAAIIARAKKTAFPCESSPAHAAFDFWIGSWDIYVNGRKAASNTTTKEMNGCLIRETYSSGNAKGESLNFLDPQDGRWKQTWVSNAGGVTHYVGSPVQAGIMAMEGTNTVVGQPTVGERVRWSAEADGSVRHVVENSSDGGVTWTKTFDGRYVRVAPASAAAPAGTAPPAGNVEQAIIQMEKDSWAAWQRHDTAFWEAYLSDDHVEVHAAPRLAGKREVVTHIGSKACAVTDYRLDDFTFRQVGPDTALLVYRAAQTTKCGNFAVPSPVWATSLFQRRNGRWLNTFYSHTPIPAPPATAAKAN